MKDCIFYWPLDYVSACLQSGVDQFRIEAMIRLWGHPQARMN